MNIIKNTLLEKNLTQFGLKKGVSIEENTEKKILKLLECGESQIRKGGFLVNFVLKFLRGIILPVFIVAEKLRLLFYRLTIKFQNQKVEKQRRKILLLPVLNVTLENQIIY